MPIFNEQIRNHQFEHGDLTRVYKKRSYKNKQKGYNQEIGMLQLPFKLNLLVRFTGSTRPCTCLE